MKTTVTRTKFGNPSTAIKKAITGSSLELGVKIASQAKLLTPVDEGQLRNSISVSSLIQTKLLNDSSGKKADGLQTTGLKGNEVYVGSNSDHTIFQEYGTIKQPAQPFLRPSAELADGATLGTIMGKYSSEEMVKEMKNRKITRS